MPLPAQAGVCMPCGPECRFAAPLRHAHVEWIWCTRRGEPRIASVEAPECPCFTTGAELLDSAAAARVIYSPGSATDRLPHEN